MPAEINTSNLNRIWADLLVEELVRAGVRLFCLAPGSRSTPLTTAVAANPRADHVMHFDERGAAFYALGFARATRRPAVWITTSGTAVANGFPAVVEASTDGVPLLLLTADRPPELRHTGANQTVDQVKIFGEYVRWHFDLPAPTSAIDPAMVLTTADQAVYRARRMPAGPVLLNAMFREPLAPEDDGRSYSEYLQPIRSWLDGTQPFTRYDLPRVAPDRSDVQAIAASLRGVGRGLVVAGRLDTTAQGDAVRWLAERLNWPLLPDACSQLRLRSDSPVLVPYYDLALTSGAFRSTHRPEAVLYFGSRSTSKKLSRYLAESAPDHHIVIRERSERFDPDHRVTRYVESDVVAFCQALIGALDDLALTGAVPADDSREAEVGAGDSRENEVRVEGDVSAGVGSTDHPRSSQDDGWLAGWMNASAAVERVIDAHDAVRAPLPSGAPGSSTPDSAGPDSSTLVSSPASPTPSGRAGSAGVEDLAESATSEDVAPSAPSEDLAGSLASDDVAGSARKGDTEGNAGPDVAEMSSSALALSEPRCARVLSQEMPDRTGLFLGSSMPIRDVDAFAASSGKSVFVAANRGASGIDGTVAAAVGYAQGLADLVTVLIGDLALLHDLNSLALVRQSKVPVILVVINNHGGGIFSFLPIADHADVFERYFGTPHDFRFEQAAEMFGLDYHAVADVEALRNRYRAAVGARASSLLEVTTDREQNVAIHREIERLVVEALG